MGKTTLEVDTFSCSYCGFVHYQLNRLVGQGGKTRYICGDCMIKAFDKGLGYVKPEGNKTVVKDGGTAPPINKGLDKKK